jgi:hypothetical protein
MLISRNQPFPRRSFPNGILNHRAFSVTMAKRGQGAAKALLRCRFVANLGHGTTADEKRKLLTEHLRSRTGHTMPRCVTCVAVFCDESLFSVPPDGAGLVSIQVQGYIQASSAKPPSTMRKWIDSAAWKPVPGGLSSDAEFQTDMRKFNDPNDSMTRLMVFGAVGANNAGRTADKAARQVGCLIENYPQTGCESEAASRHYLSFFPFLSSKLMKAIQYNGLTDRRRVGMPTGGARGRDGRTARCKEAASSTGRYHKSAGDC